MDIKTIDATKKLTIRHFKNFQNSLSDDDTIIILVDNIEIGAIDVLDFQPLFANAVLSDLSDEQVITFASNSALFIITAKDYKKWTDEWWSSRIFSTDETKVKPVTLIINCEIYKREIDTGRMYDSVSFSSSSMKQVVEFINVTRSKLYIQSLLENSEVVCRLWYGEQSDSDVMGTFDELLEKGVFICKT